MADDLTSILREIKDSMTVNTPELRRITDQFISSLEKGLSPEGGSIPMNPTWVLGEPTGNETGTYLVLNMGGTNIQISKVTLAQKKSEFTLDQSHFRIPEELKTCDAESLWDYLARCLEESIDKFKGDDQGTENIPLAFIFSYPMTQSHIDEGKLQRWTKGFNITGVENAPIMEKFGAALKKRRLPLVLTALSNDTTATMIASAYTDNETHIGCIFGTGCNAAYMEECGKIQKLASDHLPPDMPMAINCEWGAFDNEHEALPRTKYDVVIDETSPRPGQQTFEKMIAGLYLGEIFRLIIVDTYDKKKVPFLKDQDVHKLRQQYSLDSSFLSAIEEDKSDNYGKTYELMQSELNISCSYAELQFIRQVAESITTRAARLSACGISAIFKKKAFKTCHVATEGSLFEKHPFFKQRLADATKEILNCSMDGVQEDAVTFTPSIGSNLGAAVIASLTLDRVSKGNTWGVLHPESFRLKSSE